VEKMMIDKEPGEKRDRVRVTFELPSALWAERVNLVGDFNDWDTAATPMTRGRTHDDWRVTIELPVGQRYLFRYLLDGQEWLNEWHADDYVETEDGLCNSVVDLNIPSAALGVLAHPYDKAG
jgi:1,4-alpha-glucan branching enzyme